VSPPPPPRASRGGSARRDATETLPAALARFWADDHGLSVFLGLLTVLIFVLPPLALTGTVGKLLTDAVLSAVLVSGAVAATRRRWALVAVAVVAVAALGVRWGTWLLSGNELEELRATAVLATLVPLCIVILRLVMRQGRVTRRRIQGAIAAYVLLGLTWSYAYALVAPWSPSAFRGVDGGAAGAPLIYFSFVTLTTLGYGDITPVDPAARSLAILEALTGQIYPAILLARLVSLELQSRSGSRSDGEEPW